jgi:hypothetical protein
MPSPSQDIRYQPSLGYRAWTQALQQLGDTTPRPAWEELPREQQVAWAAIGGLYGAPVSFECTPEEVEATRRAFANALAYWEVDVVDAQPTRTQS